MFWVTAKEAQVAKKYPTKVDQYGKVVKLLASVERARPDGGGTGKWDCIVIQFRMPFNPTFEEAAIALEAYRLKEGELFSFSGNLHTNTDPSTGNFYASVSGKEIDTSHKADVVEYLKNWVSACEEKPIMKEAVAV